ncbi:hypothetical protein LguiA_002411 [Lonicera macranthoides]
MSVVYLTERLKQKTTTTVRDGSDPSAERTLLGFDTIFPSRIADQASGEFAPGISDLKDVPGISVFINVLLNTAALRLRRLLVTPSIGCKLSPPIHLVYSVEKLKDTLNEIYSKPPTRCVFPKGQGLYAWLKRVDCGPESDENDSKCSISGILDRAVEAEDNNHGLLLRLQNDALHCDLPSKLEYNE